MHQIRSWLYVGSFAETHDRAVLNAAGISAMLQLAAPAHQAGIETLFLRVDDAEYLPAGTIARGVNFVRARKAEGREVMVACRQGISRSTTFAIAALSEEENIPLYAAYQNVLSAHPNARPHPALLLSLMQYYEDRSILSVPALAARISL